MIIDVELLDEREDGRIKCTTEENTSIAIYKIPKTMIDLCDTDEYKKAGIYFLVDSKKRIAYVGKATVRQSGEGIVFRAKEKDAPHNKVKNWDWLIFIVDISSGVRKVFTKETIEYLEHRFYEKMNTAMKEHKYKIANGCDPDHSDIVNKDTFESIINYSIKMIYALGFDFLVQKVDFNSNTVEEKYRFTLDNKKIKAELAYDINNRKYWLLKDSEIAKKAVKSCYPWVVDMRNLIKKSIKNGKLIKDIMFDNPSMAAGVATGSSVSGTEKWVNSDGKKLGDVIR